LPSADLLHFKARPRRVDEETQIRCTYFCPLWVLSVHRTRRVCPVRFAPLTEGEKGREKETSAAPELELFSALQVQEATFLLRNQTVYCAMMPCFVSNFPIFFFFIAHSFALNC
jgi:hypothetical protein